MNVISPVAHRDFGGPADGPPASPSLSAGSAAATLPSVSVLICTRNRAEQLRSVLDSLSAMEVPQGLCWEMVVVDNGSTDPTPAVVASYADRLPIRCVVEPTAGLAHARNRGATEARGTHICWTDDDVLVGREWLAAYVRAFQAFPDAVFFGGPIQPRLEGTPPAWFVENLESLGNILAQRDQGSVSRALLDHEDWLPFGANYAVRGAEQRAHLYDPELGVGPSQKRVGEETSMFLSIRADGARGAYVADARITHIIPQRRQTLSYVAEYERSLGETFAFLSRRGDFNFMGQSVSEDVRRFLGVPAKIGARLVLHRAAYAVTRLTRPSSTWLHHWRRYTFFCGAARYYRRSHQGWSRRTDTSFRRGPLRMA